jgi:hypothetical protein
MFSCGCGGDGLVAIPRYAPSYFDQLAAQLARARRLGIVIPAGMPVDTREHMLAAIVLTGALIRRCERRGMFGG